jgi:hypothetical protein
VTVDVDASGRPAGDPAPAERMLPPGTRLLHIGPPKTGTTSLQSALFEGRPAMLAQGVRHAGRGRNSASAAQAVLGRKSAFQGGVVPPIGRWNRLVAEVREAQEPCVVVSSEFFADATPEAAQRVVDALDPSRIHVAITLRPIASILTSQWAQYIADGMRAPFDAWLHAMFEHTQPRLSPNFWVRHRHDELVARWAGVVGADRVTVVIVESERNAVLRAFERLLGLTEGTLVADPDLANRSLTLPEAEAVREFNRQFAQAGLPRPLLSKIMHFGATRSMKREVPDPAWPVVELPDWALEPTRTIARQIVDGIRASGVRVMGDLESLARVPETTSPAGSRAGTPASPRVAASMAMGVLFATGTARSAAEASTERRGSELRKVPTAVLGGVVVGRARAGVRTTVHRLYRRVRQAGGKGKRVPAATAPAAGIGDPVPDRPAGPVS